MVHPAVSAAGMRIMKLLVGRPPQTVAEMPHSCQKCGNPGFVSPNAGRFLGNLRHPHRIAVPIETFEGGGPAVGARYC